MQEVQPAVQAAMLLGAYGPADPVGLEVLLRKGAIWNLMVSSIRES